MCILLYRARIAFRASSVECIISGQVAAVHLVWQIMLQHGPMNCGNASVCVLSMWDGLAVRMCVRTLSSSSFLTNTLSPRFFGHSLARRSPYRWIVHRTNSWGYLKNGTFDGMIGALVRKEIDVGGSPIFFRSERAKVIDYTARTWISRWVNCDSTQKILTTETSAHFFFARRGLSWVGMLFSVLVFIFFCLNKAPSTRHWLNFLNHTFTIIFIWVLCLFNA